MEKARVLKDKGLCALLWEVGSGFSEGRVVERRALPWRLSNTWTLFRLSPGQGSNSMFLTLACAMLAFMHQEMGQTFTP